jgi:hypothetical protein
MTCKKQSAGGASPNISPSGTLHVMTDKHEARPGEESERISSEMAQVLSDRIPASDVALWRQFCVFGPTPSDPNYYLTGPEIPIPIATKAHPFRTGVYSLLEEAEKPDAANRNQDRIQTSLWNLDAEMEKVKQALKDGHESAARGFLGTVDIRFTRMTDEMWVALVSFLNETFLKSVSDHLYEFRKEGDHWILVFGGARSVVPDNLGFRYIHMLLGRPDQDVSSTALVDSVRLPVSAPGFIRSDLKEAGLSESAGTQGSPIESITPDELRRFRSEIKSLDERITEARRLQNHAEVERLHDEKDWISSEIKKKTDRFGKSRKIGFQPDNNRRNVQKAIDRALEVIRDTNPKCFEFLSQKKHLKTGTFCRYCSDASIDWYL